MWNDNFIELQSMLFEIARNISDSTEQREIIVNEFPFVHCVG